MPNRRNPKLLINSTILTLSAAREAGLSVNLPHMYKKFSRGVERKSPDYVSPFHLPGREACRSRSKDRPVRAGGRLRSGTILQFRFPIIPTSPQRAREV
jgi:hypothetical protein